MGLRGHCGGLLVVVCLLLCCVFSLWFGGMCCFVGFALLQVVLLLWVFGVCLLLIDCLLFLVCLRLIVLLWLFLCCVLLMLGNVFVYDCVDFGVLIVCGFDWFAALLFYGGYWRWFGIACVVVG